VLIDHGRRLRAAVAIHDVEIERGDTVLAEGAFERGSTVHGFGCVISHISIVVLFTGASLGNRSATFERGSGLELSFSMFLLRVPAMAQATHPPGITFAETCKTQS
jgi:hypothetical protein